MTGTTRHIMVSTGEPSGDIHGADLVTALQKLDPTLEFSGIGGPRMAAAGVDLFFPIDHLSAMGLTEVIRQIGPIKQAFDLFRRHLRRIRPDLLILVDYPGFNLKVGRYAKNNSAARVFYYITPKVWAWKKSRLLQIRQNVDHAGLIFPFEEKIFKKAGIPATYVGNPLLDQYPRPVNRSPRTAATSSNPWVIGLLPGSRKNEIHNLLDLMLTAARKIHDHLTHVRFLVSAADAIPVDMIEGILGARKDSGHYQVISGHPRQIFEQADMLIAASGTITLEAALCTIPTVIIYKMSPITFRIAKTVVKVKHVGLANIIVGRQVMPELMQGAATPENISHTSLDMLENLEKYTRDLEQVRRLMGSPGAAGLAAKIALDLARGEPCRTSANRYLTNHGKSY